MSLEKWEKVAREYSAFVREGKDACRREWEPVVLELLGEVAGKRILDAGCGEGCWSRRLVEMGAEVTGLDGSGEMIRLAAEASARGGQRKPRYVMGDLLKPLPFPDRSFDLVVSNMVLMDLPAVSLALCEFARVLAPKGALVFSITHPCFFPYDWVTSKSGTRVYKAVTDYLHERVEELDCFGHTMHYHRPLSAYFGNLEAAGFLVKALREPMPLEQGRIPSFLVVKAVKER